MISADLGLLAVAVLYFALLFFLFLSFLLLLQLAEFFLFLLSLQLAVLDVPKRSRKLAKRLFELIRIIVMNPRLHPNRRSHHETFSDFQLDEDLDCTPIFFDVAAAL